VAAEDASRASLACGVRPPVTSHNRSLTTGAASDRVDPPETALLTGRCDLILRKHRCVQHKLDDKSRRCRNIPRWACRVSAHPRLPP